MGLKATFNMQDIRRKLLKDEKTISDSIIRRLQFLGVKCAREARLNRTFQDQTSNLISSIGFVVAKDGKIITENYEVKAGAVTGETEGKGLAYRILSEYPKGHVLILTAGMEYAAAVEARGYNVLSSAEALAEKEWPEMIRKIKERG